MTMDKELWDALDSVEQSINKLVCIKEVFGLHPISTGDMVQILEAIITEFSDKQKQVWLEVEKIYLEKDKQEEMNCTHEDEYADLHKKYTYCYNRNIELENVVQNDVRTALLQNGSMNKDITLLRPKPDNIRMSGIYLFRFTVQRPYEVKRFCPDMNYKEFDSQGCESRLTPQSCMNTVHHRYFPDWSLCKTRIDYGDDDAVYDAHKHRVDVRERRDR